MRLHAFRIKNFRSINDTGFQELSPDGISLIVGQNESGKSSILEAIHAFETGEVSEDDIRSGGLMPEVTCIFKFENVDEVITCLSKEMELPKNFHKTFKNLNYCIALNRKWITNNYADGRLSLENLELKSVWHGIEKSSTTAGEPVTDDETDGPETPKPSVISEENFVEEIFYGIPAIAIFEDNSLLPPTIDLDDLVNKNTKAPGYEGAKNFLLIAEIKPEELQNPSSIRIMEDTLEQKNKKVNAELQKYWHQTVGKKDKIEVALELKNHTSAKEGKEGHPYLAFWIRDKNGKLSPVQRSRGVKWFISFYLKLEATAKAGSNRVFLIDEPGSNLHAKAQKDILSVFEKQKDNLQIVFTTHSPYLLDVDKVYRVHAVERADTEDDKSETKVIPFHKLGSASTDTLMPLYTSMGVDVSHQSAISNKNNILLEEISAFFYMKAFWKLFSRTETVHFLPATGCPNLPLLANLMLGWGLSFAIVLDDDSHGRKVFKELKESKVCEGDRLIKIDGCVGIEDLFLKSDFTTHVIRNEKANISGTNSEYMKSQKISKVVTARDFMLAVNDEKIRTDNLSQLTKNNIEELLTKIIATLK